MNNDPLQSNDQVGSFPSSADLSALVVSLLKGVVYQDADAAKWNDLLSLQPRVRDYMTVLGLELVLDEAEGYAFLRSKSASESDEDEQFSGSKNKAVPRLVVRRQLSFPVSLLLALLRKKLAEFDALGGETRLVLSRDEIVELIRVFLPSGSNEAKLFDQVDSTINRIIDLGFLRRLKSASGKKEQSFEVRRILKAFVDAQWLAEFDQKLEVYRNHWLNDQKMTPIAKNDDHG